MHDKKLNPSYLSYFFYTICLLMFQVIIYELIHGSEYIALIWGSINIFLFFLVFLLIYSNHLMDKINFLHQHTSHYILSALYEINSFLKQFSSQDAKILKKLARDFWQNDIAFNHYFLNKEHKLIHIYTTTKNQTKLIHIKTDLEAIQALTALEKSYHTLCAQYAQYAQIIEHLPMPIWSETHHMQNKAFKDTIGHEVKFDLNETFPCEKKISYKGSRNNWHIEKTEHGQHIIFTASNVSIKDELQKKLQTLEDKFLKLFEKLNISIAIYNHDTKLAKYNGAYPQTWSVASKFLNQKPTLGEMIDHLRENNILPEHHNYERFKKERLKLFKNLLIEEDDILYLPNEKIFRSIISPYQDGSLMFIHEDVSEFYQLKSNLHSLENLTDTMINDTEDFILIFSDNGRLKYFNAMHKNFEFFKNIQLQKNSHISEIIKQLENNTIASDICSHVYQAAIESQHLVHTFKDNDHTIEIQSTLLQDDSILNRYSYRTDAP